MKPTAYSAVRVLPRKTREQLIGVFDEQAVSVLATLLKENAKFGDLSEETRLSKASLSRVLKSLVRSQMVKRTSQGYSETRRGRRVIQLVLKIAEEETDKAMENVRVRLRQMTEDYRANHSIFHSDPKWERSADKALIEVMAMDKMTGIQSLLFQQRFQEEAVREEEWLRRSPSTR